MRSPGFESSDVSGGRSRRLSTRLGRAAAVIALALAPTEAHAAVEGEAQFILNTFAFLVWGALVMWMAAGFTMLEAGSVRTNNASMICLKNIGLYSIAGLTSVALKLVENKGVKISSVFSSVVPIRKCPEFNGLVSRDRPRRT